MSPPLELVHPSPPPAAAPSSLSAMRTLLATPDEALALEAAAGQRDAFERLVGRYAGRVQSVLERRVGDHHAAMDLAQEVWLRVYRALPRFRPDGSFRSWLFAIVLNAARDERRRMGRDRSVPLEDTRSATADPDYAERAEIDHAIDAVPEPFRTALVLVDVEGLDYEEAAAALGCALGTAKSRVHRGRVAFRDQWRRQIGDAEPTTPHSTPGGSP